MKITEVIIEAGRPVQFYPSLAKVFGIEEAIFIGQLLYWTGKEADKRGIRKSIGEIESETSLSSKQQKRIKEKLQKQGCLKYEYDRTNHKSYYKIFANKINEIYQRYSPKGYIPKGTMVSSQRDEGIVPKGLSSITENTSKITSENTNDFQIFYKAFPIKKGKEQAQITWNKLSKAKKLPNVKVLLKAIELQIAEKKQLKDKDDFAPNWKYPSSWLNAFSWEDEVEIINKPKRFNCNIK